jgi:mannose-1-phosphate guanylyltransferase
MSANRLGIPRSAMLLAAGRGERLRPLTDTMPKCMVPIAGKPLIEHNIEWLRKYRVTDLVINLNHQPESIVNYFEDGSRWQIGIKYLFEPELLGTAGGVKNAADHFDGPFFVWYADNLSTCRLDRLWSVHAGGDSTATIALHQRDDPTQSGIVGLNSSGRITRFLEKPRPEQVFSNWVSAGIFVLDHCVLDAIPQGFSDFGRDIFPMLLERGITLRGYRMSEDEGLWWIDTPQDLKRAQAEFNDITSSPGGSL